MAYLASAAATLGEALQLAQRYYALEDTDLLFQLDFEDDHPVISLGSRVYAAGQGARYREMLIFGVYVRTSQIAGPGLSPLKVEIGSSEKTHCEKLTALAGCEVVCGKGRYVLHMPKDALTYPIPIADGALLSHLRQVGHARLSQQPETAIRVSGQVAHILGASLPGRVPLGDEVAKQLSMTRRTMTRHLSSEGTSFKQLLDTARCQLAKSLIKSGEGIAQVAFMLDFADQAAFSVAFKRWSGDTPARFRKTVL